MHPAIASQDIVVITARAEREPVRAFLRQLQQLAYRPHRIRQLVASEVNRLPVPAVALVDIIHNAQPDLPGIPANVRAVWEYVPIILFSAAEDLRSLRFDPLMHDYIALPTSLHQLEARLRFALRKQPNTVRQRDTLEAGGIQLTASTHEALIQGKPVELTYKEFELLKFFLSHPRRVFSRSEILETVWESDYYGGTRTVDVHILRLRAKIGRQAGALIHTVRNVGYRFG